MDYFTGVGSKTNLKFAQPIKRNPALLAEYLKKEKCQIAANKVEVDLMFKKWCDTLFSGFNIVVQGPMSKYRLLETFRIGYLESNKIPDLDCHSKKNGTSVLRIKTLKFHGFCPISLEPLCHYLFNITEARKMTDEDSDVFLNYAKVSKTHYVFLIHSFELFYRESRKVCDLIFQLCKKEPNYIHLLVSSDHIYSNKILYSLKLELQLVFYPVPYGKSFFNEVTHSIEVMSQDHCAKNATQARLYDEDLNLRSVRDVYQALQPNAKKILVYILENSLVTEEPMIFERLFGYCQQLFIVRRANVLRNYIGELADHRIIEIDERDNIICRVSRSNAKKFLEKEFEQED